LEGPGEIVVEQALKFEAEYEAIIAGFYLANELEVTRLTCNSDSRLMVGQLREEYEVRETLLQQYFHFIRNLLTKFE